MSVSPQEIAYEKAHSSDYDARGLAAFCIAGSCLITVAVGLRMWSRKLQRTPFKSDDFTLIVALVLTVGSACCYIVMATHYGYGKHFYTLPVKTQQNFLKTQYAFNIIYTTGYPLSRISLVLLYHRIFVQQWARMLCKFFVVIYAGYAISTALADIWLTIPINAYWDKSVVAKKSVQENKLYLANAGFNISTDAILLILPLAIIWQLQMDWIHKTGLSFIFALGCLTMVASIVRLTLFFKVSSIDPSYNLTLSSYWTAAEQFLGILCPCLVTFRPLVKAARVLFTSQVSSGGRYKSDTTKYSTGDQFHRYTPSRLDSNPDQDIERQSISKLVDVPAAHVAAHAPKKSFLPFFNHKSNQAQTSGQPPYPTSIPPNAQPMKNNTFDFPTAPPPAAHKNTPWHTKLGLGQNSSNETEGRQDAIALAALDPRAPVDPSRSVGERIGDDQEGGYPSTFGTTTEAKAVPLANGVLPMQGTDSDKERGTYPIEVQREFILERE